MIQSDARVIILLVNIRIPHAQSLKAKRQVVRSVRDRLRSKFNVSVSEVGDLEKWQTAQLGVASIGNSAARLNSVAQKIVEEIDRNGDLVILESGVEIL